MKLTPVILSGGSGTGMWSCSRSMYPSFFLWLTKKRWYCSFWR